MNRDRQYIGLERDVGPQKLYILWNLVRIHCRILVKFWEFVGNSMMIFIFLIWSFHLRGPDVMEVLPQVHFPQHFNATCGQNIRSDKVKAVQKWHRPPLSLWQICWASDCMPPGTGCRKLSVFCSCVYHAFEQRLVAAIKYEFRNGFDITGLGRLVFVHSHSTLFEFEITVKVGVFRPSGATQCTDQGEICHGSVHYGFTLAC